MKRAARKPPVLRSLICEAWRTPRRTQEATSGFSQFWLSLFLRRRARSSSRARRQSSKSSHARSARRERRTRVTDEQAAKFVGYRLKRARTHLDNLREFSTLRRELLDGKRWRATSPPRSRSETMKAKPRGRSDGSAKGDPGDRGQRGEGRRRRQRQTDVERGSHHARLRR